jgi:nucleoid-associated protein YgaU
MDLYFSKNAELRFRFPVTPRALRITSPARGGAVMTVDATEISLQNGLGLLDISFDALLPNRRYPFAVYGGGVFRPAAYFLGSIERLKTERGEFTMIFNDRSLSVTLESYSISEDASYGGDIMVGIRLREARVSSLRVIQPVTGQAPPRRPPPQAPAPKTYTVVKGDTLWAIAKRFLGNGTRWPEIHKLNKDKISNPNLIYPGERLVLP